MKQETEELKREHILALDIATHCGYFSVHESGTWNFTEGKRRNGNKQHLALKDTLTAFIREHGIQRIVAEDVSVNNHFFDMRKLAEFRGVLLCVCDELDLPEPEFVNPKVLKKYATGNGNASKDDMKQAYTARFNRLPLDDNEADAFWLFQYYVSKYRI
jgi:VCBS repeat-containing protein